MDATEQKKKRPKHMMNRATVNPWLEARLSKVNIKQWKKLGILSGRLSVYKLDNRNQKQYLLAHGETKLFSVRSLVELYVNFTGKTDSLLAIT